MHVKIQIFGKVQGVAFRYYSKKKADDLGLFGTTENQADGSVISFVQGQEDQVNAFEKWCHQGSPASRVEQVVTKILSPDSPQDYQDFSILR